MSTLGVLPSLSPLSLVHGRAGSIAAFAAKALLSTAAIRNRPGIGFGLGVAVTVDPIRTQGLRSRGEYYWTGVSNTLSCLLASQRLAGFDSEWIVCLTWSAGAVEHVLGGPTERHRGAVPLAAEGRAASAAEDPAELPDGSARRGERGGGRLSWRCRGDGGVRLATGPALSCCGSCGARERRVATLRRVAACNNNATTVNYMGGSYQ